MSMFLNPYAQGGWDNPLNQFPGAVRGAPIPSIHGALPNVSSGIPAGADQQHLSFVFEPQGSPNTGVLNCIVMGADSRPRFYISSTNSSSGAITSIKDEGGSLAATVEWQHHPVVQLQTYINQIPRQFSSQFLPLSQSREARSMTIKNKTYQWTRDPERDCVYLHNTSYNPREYLGYLARSSNGSVVLSVLPSAVSQGLLDVCILATTLFFSNRCID
ncbi:hypothetical protein NMY22_g13942 [Coprinellus aureogranulatus]|nr:hypothetical protein NMY22_g13942 [Coprinellus aureogranulatus]